MDPVDVITRNARGIELLPAATSAQLGALAAELGLPVPRELRAVLEHTAGLGGTAFGTIDFTGSTMAYEDRDLFPAGVPIAADGAGNFWVLDVVPAADGTRVFFASHDPPLVVYVSDGLGAFLDELLRADAAAPPDAQPRPALTHEALAADDLLRPFAATLDERSVVFDLRAASPGAAFEWGRFGPRTIVRRFGFEPVFACAPPPRAPGGRLFRRGR